MEAEKSVMNISFMHHIRNIMLIGKQQVDEWGTRKDETWYKIMQQ